MNYKSEMHRYLDKRGGCVHIKQCKACGGLGAVSRDSDIPSDVFEVCDNCRGTGTPIYKINDAVKKSRAYVMAVEKAHQDAAKSKLVFKDMSKWARPIFEMCTKATPEEERIIRPLLESVK